MEPSSLVDVAKKADVSLATASRVLNNNSSVNEELRTKVIAACHDIGFTPKVSHRGIALITSGKRANSGYPLDFGSLMTERLWHVLAARGYAVEIFTADNIGQSYSANIQGAIGVVSTGRLQELAQFPNFPLLSVTKPMLEMGIHSVRVNHRNQGEQATRYLLECGHRKIGFLACGSTEWSCSERLAGYLDALDGFGVAPDESLVGYSRERAMYDCLYEWKRKGVTAIANFSYDNVLEVNHILCNIFGMHIAKDISLVSLEDIPVFAWSIPPITTIRQPLEKLAQLAADTLIDQIQRVRSGQMPGNAPVEVVLEAELIERDSVASV